MTPADVVREWIDRFNAADVAGLVALYAENAMAGDWAILEWSDPLGLRDCGFFQIRDGKIVFQRGYFDQLTFFRLQGIPVPEEYLGS